VDSVLIAGHAATADAGTARPGGLPVADAAGVVDKLGEDSDGRLAVGDRVIAYAIRLGLHGGSYHESPQHTGLRCLASITQESSRTRVSAGQKRYS
jgi:NADPH:quinone reductase-like Zn-dependent oxidoreductase